MAKSVQSTSLTIPADVRFVPSIRLFSYEFMRQVGAGEQNARRTEFIVGELCANAIEYGKSVAASVQLKLILEGSDSVKIECTNSLEDSSVTAESIVERFHKDVDEASKRGRGFFVIRQWTENALIEEIDGGIKISVVQSF